MTLATIPDKRYFTIGEVAHLCEVKPHVLRYWEQEFAQLRPSKRRGNRRYYQRKDVLMIRQIYDLLYVKGYTISGARQYLSQEKQANREIVQSFTIVQSAHVTLPSMAHRHIQESITMLESVLDDLRF